MSEEVWYRYEDKYFAPPLDEFDNPVGGRSLEIHLFKFPVVKTTPKGAWLDIGEHANRFASRDATKRFACPTLAEAKESFIARKRKQARIYRKKAEEAEAAVRKIELGGARERVYFARRTYVEFA